MSYQFAQELSQRAPTVVLLSSPSCGPCQLVKPALTRLSDELGFALVTLNAGDNFGLCQDLLIRAVPTILVLKGGAVTGQHTGAMTAAQLGAFLDQEGVTHA